MKLDVVVSRYNEDLDWLNVFRKFECPVTLYVYDKNDASVSPRFDFAKVIYKRLPNIGREGHTYLEHIQSYYECFDDTCYTIFCQGNIDEHINIHRIKDRLEKERMLYEYLSRMLTDARYSDKGISETTAYNYDFKQNSATYDFRISYWKGILEPADQCLGSWFENLLSIKFPEKPLWWPSALFCTRNDVICRRPLVFYVALQKQLMSFNPEKGHFLERSWYYILS